MEVKKKSTMEDRILNLEYFEEKTDRHISEMKHSITTISNDVTDIKNAVIGNKINGDSGIVPDLKVMKIKQDVADKTLLEHGIYFKQLAWAVGILLGGVVSIAIAVINSK